MSGVPAFAGTPPRRPRRRAAALLLAALASAAPAAAGRLPVVAGPGARVQPFGVYGTTRDRVVAVTAPATFTAPVEVPAGGRLIGAVAVPDRVWTESVVTRAAPLRFRVVFEGDGAPVTLYERTIDIAGRPADRRWYDFGRDLSALAGRRGTLRFETTPVAPDGAATLGLWAIPAVARCPADAPSVLLITIDALRADHLSGTGYGRPTTPHLDAFAADAASFRAAFAAAPKTLPSIPQTLTGRLFPAHGDAPALAALLGGEHFAASRAVVNNPFVARWLQAQAPGFETRVDGELDARAITSAALRFLTAAGRCRTALYLHYLDTHTPYRPPPRYARRFVDPTAATAIGLDFADVTGAWQGRYGPADRRRIVDLYDGAIAWTDRQLGRLFRGLARRGRLADTVVVVTADHGEELWDHGAFFHGQSLYDEQLHVPLIVRLPRGGRGRVVPAVVSTVDVLPTLLDAAGLAPAATDGTSLVPQVSGAGGADGDLRAVFATVSHAEPRSPPRHAVRDGATKVIRNIADGSVALYDLATDPEERTPLEQDTPRTRELRAVLDAVRLRIAAAGWQIRLESTAEKPVAYVLRLAGEPPVPLIDVDRLTLESSDRIAVGARSGSLTVAGRLDPGDEDHLRLDVEAASGTLRAELQVDGAPAPAGTLRLGPAGEPADDGTIAIDDPALVGAPADARGAAGPAVQASIWRAPAGAGADAPPPLDDATRARLRELGYVD